ncbi:MAG: UDP-glucose 4-epimerase GalE [Leptonema sp. (in: Bacteria)]|nr:UDP-glucose 4-epimerase GalE [Leptonema sp. (in: bacteria)]
MKVGVTGGTGYIGSHIVFDLIERDYEVVVIDNFSTGNRVNVLHHPNYTLIEGDIRNEAKLSQFFEQQLDVIFHFAASKAAGESMINPIKYSDNNLRGSLYLLEKAIQNQVRYFIFSSSAAVYGDPKYIPIDEKHPRQPANFYGYTKLVIEDTLEWYSKLNPNFHFASLRYFNAAGYDLKGRVRGLENQPQNLLPIVMEVASGLRPKLEIYGNDYATEDGTCIRDYIHVNDLSNAHLLAMDYLRNKNTDLTVNLGVGRGISVQQIVDEARRITGRSIQSSVVDRRLGDPASLYAAPNKAFQLLGWRAENSGVESLIESTWQAYLNS